MRILYFTSKGNIGLTQNRLCFKSDVEAGVDSSQSAREKAFNVLRNGDQPRTEISAKEALTAVRLRTALRAIARNRGERDEVSPSSLTTYPAYYDEEQAVG